jgi:hypothetical protein
VGVGPFVLERLDESLGLAVPARCVGRGDDVARAGLLEQRLEAPRSGVDLGAVGHHRLGWAESELCEPGERPLERAGIGVCVVAAVQLDVGEAAVIVDDDVEVLPAHPAAAVVLVLAAERAVARRAEAPELLHVHVQQRSGPRPFVAAKAVALSAPPAREAMALEHLPDSRAGPAHQSGQPPGAEVGLAAGAQDRLLLGGRQPPRRAVRARGAIAPPPARRSCRQSVGLSMPPAMGRRGRHVEGGGRRLQRHPALDRRDKRLATGRSERGPRVSLHPGPP